MKTTDKRYPVDRYLVESSKRYDIINIIDDDIWNSEPALRPEDEIMLRKLHDMLQTTSDDLKLLSGELSKYHETKVQKKTLPTPLDEDFNEKVHIEEVVNARFHGHKLDDPEHVNRTKDDNEVRKPVDNSHIKQYVNHGVQVSQIPNIKKPSIPKNLKISRTNLIQINENPIKENISVTLDPSKNKKEKSVVYNEFSYKYAEPQQISTEKAFRIQEMPSINIRSELREQKVLQLDIIPDSNDTFDVGTSKNNALVIEMKHEETPAPSVSKQPLTFNHIKHIPVENNKPITRKVSKMSVCESSESANNLSSESQRNLRSQKNKFSSILRALPRTVGKQKKTVSNKNETKRPSNIDEWHRKLESVYGTSKNTKVRKNRTPPKRISKQDKPPINKPTKPLNNTEYIPYSKLTIGGVNVSDIEREISSVPNRNDVVLSPILDKILSSRENSFHNDSPRKSYANNTKILTTSDENLLQEVLDIEKQVTRTLADTKLNNDDDPAKIDQNVKSNDNKNDSYDDDFEDEKSDESPQSREDQINESASSESIPPNNSRQDEKYNNNASENIRNESQIEQNLHNKTFTKTSNLSFKNSVDVFEFVHSIDTQETGTQSNTTIKISPRDSQVSPKQDKTNMQPIRNDLWSSIDPRGEVEKMFKLEKDFIQKLIVEEYGDLLEKQLNKPSTSKNVDIENCEINVVASQKNTQTSPARVKSVMTSPTKTKTRTTSPFALSLTVNKQTSPIVVVSNDEELKVEIDNEDLGISVNLSSPRFSLRLPQTSRDVISNIGHETYSNREKKLNNMRKHFSSSSSVDGDYSSSDISSLGEINKIYKRRLKKSRIPSISEISSSSRYSTDASGLIIPVKSEGEASVSLIRKKKSNPNKSEGEISYGQLN